MDIVEIADLVNNSCRTCAVLNDADELIGGTIIATSTEDYPLALTLSTPLKSKSPFVKGRQEMLLDKLSDEMVGAVRDLLPSEFGYCALKTYNDFFVVIDLDESSIEQDRDYSENAYPSDNCLD